jgi:uncharacterized DUF497 family protein
MEIEFDPAKDKLNLKSHTVRVISLREAENWEKRRYVRELS